jgi:hypothetical protein
VGFMLRQAQHERTILNHFKTCPVRPELVEAYPELVEGGERRVFKHSPEGVNGVLGALTLSVPGTNAVPSSPAHR